MTDDKESLGDMIDRIQSVDRSQRKPVPVRYYTIGRKIMNVRELIIRLRECDQDKKIAVSDINGDGGFNIVDVETCSDMIVICPDYQNQF